MNAPLNAQYAADIQVRKNLDFQLEQHMPRFWFGGHPFKTRVFDALSLTFPDGERYFISSIRMFRDQISDPDLQARVKDFILQEAQHGIAHDKMNKLMIEQGMPVHDMLKLLNEHFNFVLKHRSPEYNIAMTAAAEHLTALMAECFYSKKETLAEVDPYVRALFAWHAIEEMEHRDVAFDVMKTTSDTSYLLRAYALAMTSVLMFGLTLYRTNVMLKADGFGPLKRAKLFAQGVPWLIGKKGVLSSMKKPYLDWFKPDFHPSQHPVLAQYPIWVKTLKETGDPIKAGQALWEAGK
ncbi:metal-dependent hydrolase [Alkanindiges sp. WGS2144]|uniref:metal-dependent hydrolase n=1 Tax=Alkanindiges sp. WGS2144 TaxID=3366808 RepID=UPI003752A902